MGLFSEVIAEFNVEKCNEIFDAFREDAEKHPDPDTRQALLDQLGKIRKEVINAVDD